LALLAARSGAGFVRFIVAITDPFYRPFRGIVASPSTDAGHTLMMPLVIAIVAYLLLHLAINGLVTNNCSSQNRDLAGFFTETIREPNARIRRLCFHFLGLFVEP
jgi:uncharacterized protein YggT (Ycf19 family)